MNKYSVNGLIIDGKNDTIVGYGHADILVQDKMAEVSFSAKITETGTTSQNWRYGLNPNLICSSSGAPQITPLEGGTLLFLDSEGKLLFDRFGYGGTTQIIDGFWTPARVYTTSGGVGAWESTLIPIGTTIIGVCYGTVE